MNEDLYDGVGMSLVTPVGGLKIITKPGWVYLVNNNTQSL